MSSKRPFLCTVDVEALPGRCREDHVRRLIYGDFDEGMALGIDAMMDLGDEFGCPFVMFLDMPEIDRYGADIVGAAQHIVDRGHDLQLHLHPEMLSETYWNERGLPMPEGRRWRYGEDHIECVMADFTQRMRNIRGDQPLGYRAGSFQVSKVWLEAAVRHGYTISSNHSHFSFLNQDRVALAEPDAPPFRWESGIVELPVTQINVDGIWRAFSVPMNNPDDPHFSRTLNALAEEESGKPIVLLLHSWSMLKYSGRGKQFDGVAEHKFRKLRRIVEFASEHFSPMSLTEYAKTVSPDLPERIYPLEADR